MTLNIKSFVKISEGESWAVVFLNFSQINYNNESVTSIDTVHTSPCLPIYPSMRKSASPLECCIAGHRAALASVPSPGQISVSECRTADRKYATLLTFTPGHHPAQGAAGDKLMQF